MSERFDLPFDDPAPPPSGRGVLSVSELTARLKSAVESRFGQVAVEGELVNCRKWSSGHIYFTLKDDYAQLRAVMFRMTARALKFAPEDGMNVVARGRLSVYETKGEYQLVCDLLEPRGLGALQAAFEQLKRKLSAEGLFDAARKRPLPVQPRTIGLVTSLDGAAVRDVLRVLVARHPTAQVVIRPARVQGDEAPAELVRALSAIARVKDVDVVIIGRGGGSAEDLWAFNDERVARAIVACPIPVISAVGHEVDFTIADFVADVRAATPSNAAELVVERADHVRTRIDRAAERLRSSMRLFTNRLRQRVDRADTRVRRWPTAVVLRGRDRQELAWRLRHAAVNRAARARRRFDELRRRLERRDIHRVVAGIRTRLVGAESRLAHLATARRLRADAQVRELGARLHALSPLAVLGRGYAVCWNDEKTGIIRSSQAVEPGDAVRVTLADGELQCRVQDRTR
jgi:exodeoxyribonuclease VII large subunit